jgi:hypothetical protein
MSLVLPRSAMAGAQIEEPLIDSVRTALSSAIHNKAPPVPEFGKPGAPIYLRWLGEMSERLKKKLPDWLTRKEFRRPSVRGASPGSTSAWFGLVQVRATSAVPAVSSAGARGCCR